MNRRIAFDTLGCRLNQYETDAIATEFAEAGYTVVPFAEPADAYIINTCTVTARSDRKSRNLIYRAGKAGGRPLVVVTGCYVENRSDIPAALEGPHYVVDNDRKSSIFAIVDAHFRGESPDVSAFPSDRFAFGTGAGGFHTRGSVKIQDGCSHRCSYCIIPAVRGKAVSRPAGAVFRSVGELAGHGVLETVITGVNIGSYESDGLDLGGLLGRIIDLRERGGYPFRIRVSSIEPYRFTESFYRALSHPAVCPHLHLCLQSGSDRILRAMARGYRTDLYMEIVTRLREARPDINLTTDLIVGFPGETDGEFEESLDAVRAVGFSHVHTFPYSARKGTPAAELPAQIPQTVKAERAERVRILSEELKLRYRASLVGKEQTVLAETGSGDGWVRGFGEHYVPVRYADTGEAVNVFRRVRITGIEPGADPALMGEIP